MSNDGYGMCGMKGIDMTVETAIGVEAGNPILLVADFYGKFTIKRVRGHNFVMTIEEASQKPDRENRRKYKTPRLRELGSMTEVTRKTGFVADQNCADFRLPGPENCP